MADGHTAKRLPKERNGALIKIGNGEIGGKAMGFPFLETLVDLQALSAEIAPHEVRIPETWVLATDVFDDFIEKNGLERCLGLHDDEQIRREFLKAKMAPELVEVLKEYLATHPGPIAVRSSALTEDATTHPAAGLYCTFMIPNNDASVALDQLAEAIKLVFASLFSKEASQYLRFHNIPHENEKMAVILEEVVGTRCGDFFFPLVSGVAQSLNFFPVGSIRPEDGAATIAVGLGRKIVDGHAGMRFCPRYPTVRPQMRHVRDILATAQEELDAVDLARSGMHLTGQETQTLASIPLQDLDSDALDLVTSILDEETSMLRDAPTLATGPRVVTFNRFLREELFPLPTVLARLLDAAQYGFGMPVEIEFALRMEESEGRRRGVLFLLQGRTMPAMRNEVRIEMPDDLPEERILLSTNRAMGHGATDGIRHVIFVDPADFGGHMSPECAREIAHLNERLAEGRHPFLLMGPGRWGSCTQTVGIPITYPVVSGAALISEISTEKVRIEPSQGSHFFHNVVSGGLYYMTVDETQGGLVNLAWLRAQPNRADTRWARLIESPVPLSIRVDGKSQRGIVYLD